MDALSVIKFNVVNLAFKTRASSIHLNKFKHGYPGEKIFHLRLYKVLHRKVRGILSLLISLRVFGIKDFAICRHIGILWGKKSGILVSH